MNPSLTPVAVIDIGSNSIKLLVASRDGSTRRLDPLFQRTEETRIGTGITGNPPRIADAAMDRAIASINLLLADAAAYRPGIIRVVATSAVRDAANRDVFADRVAAATGQPLTVLSGDDEARGIGRGIACDPALAGVSSFYLFDLGGGSLEMLEFQDGAVAQLCSLQLGCVRVTEHCLPDTSRAFTAAEIETVRRHVRDIVARSGFRFGLQNPVTAVATGGTTTTFRVVEAAASGKALAATSPVLPIGALNSLAARLCQLSLEQRRTIPGMPPARADVFPAALLTLVELAGFARVTELRHSFYNLRFGIASEILESRENPSD